MEETYSLKLTSKELDYLDSILFRNEVNPLAYVIHSKIALTGYLINPNESIHKIDRKEHINYNCTIDTEIQYITTKN